MAAVLAASPPPPPPMFSNGSVSSPMQTTQTYTPSRTSFPEELATSTSHTQSQQQLRPAKNIEAFKSLLPPPVEFVEGSSTGAIALSVAEGKYDPINVGPPLLNGRLSNGSAEVCSYSHIGPPSIHIHSCFTAVALVSRVALTPLRLLPFAVKSAVTFPIFSTHSLFILQVDLF